MPNTHRVVRELAMEGKVEITQRGNVIDASSTIRGPYRIRNVKSAEKPTRSEHVAKQE